MALNFSHRPIFPARLLEDNLGSPMSISSGFVGDGVSERNSDVYGMSRLINRELVDCLDFLEDSWEGDGSRDYVPGDVLDLLPSDPFDMDISTTFTAITGWLDDLNLDYGGGYGRDERAPIDGSYQLFAGLNYIRNNAFRFQAFPFGNEGFLHSSGSGELGGFGMWSDESKAGSVSCHSDPQSPFLMDTIQTLRVEPETSGEGFSAWSERKLGGVSCHSDPKSPYHVDTIQTLGIEPQISGGEFGAWSDERKSSGVSCHSDPKSPYHVDTIQTLGTEPQISGGGFDAWSDERSCVSCHSDPKSPYHVDTIQTLGIEPQISGGGFSAWSDERKACHFDPKSPYHVDTIQTLGIEPQISGGGFSAWSDERKACHSDPKSPYHVDTIQTLGIEPQIFGGGFSAWSDGRKAGGLSCYIDPQSSYVVDAIQTFGIEPQISGGGFSAWSDGRKPGGLSCHIDPKSSYVVDTIQTLGIEPDISGGRYGAWSDGRKSSELSCHTDLKSPPPYAVDKIQTLGIEPEPSGVQPVILQEGNCDSSDAGGPHAALNFVLGYLGTRELLVVESVCKSLQSTAEGDPFFWRNINICGKLDVKITDSVLLKLTSKAQGGLESLSLVNCVMISDDGLNKVLLHNPKVTKLCVPGCTRLTIGGIVDNLKAFKSKGRPGIKHLSIAGMYGVTEAHFKELEKLLLGTVSLSQLITHEPRFYRGGIHFSSFNHGRAIDIERCPKCMNMRIVYDCPVVGCKGIKEGDTNTNTHRCRGCTLCIPRCDWCGRCIDETVHEETFCLDLRCIDCGKQILKCE